MNSTDNTRVPINVEDYPGIDPGADEGKEELSAIAYRLALGKTPIHFVFRHHGKEIGEMIITSLLNDQMH